MAFSFGTPSTQSSTFGAAAKPTFSFGGGATTTTTSRFAGFGAPATSTGFGGFGAPATSTAAPFGTLGTAPASTAPSLFGGTGFGATAAKPTTGFGNTSFGTNTFGTTPAFGAPTFGSSAPTFGSAAPTFGTGSTLGGTNTFGTSFGAGGNFGQSFGTKPNTGFTGFGNVLGSAPQFGQQQQQQQQQQQPQGPASAHEALVAAVFNCCVFGDERDQVLAKWNLIQAQWGTGQAYYSRNTPPLELNEQNPLCRFKAVGYSRLGGREDKDGHVAMLFNKAEQDIKTNQQALTTSLHSLLGNKPNLAVNIECVKAVSDNKTQYWFDLKFKSKSRLARRRQDALATGGGPSSQEDLSEIDKKILDIIGEPAVYGDNQHRVPVFVVIYVVDKGAGGTHISASELGAFLNAGNARNALAGAGCTSVSAVTAPSPQLLAQYLQTAPPGMDMRLWKQAQADNPDSENYIPVPIIGFSEIKFRSRCQSEQAKLQAQWLQRAAGELAELRTRRAAASARLAQLAARLHARRHTLLQVVARREVMGRVGAALSPEEEAARARLHELTSQLATPPLYNGRLNELLCAVRLQRSASAGMSHERYHLDPGAQEDVKQFLTMQQKGMAHLLDTARKDLAALGTIAEGMSRLVRA